MGAEVVASNADAMVRNYTDRLIKEATVFLPKLGGQGVLIPGNMILTAAHCVPCSSRGGMYQGMSPRYDVEVQRRGHGWSTVSIIAAPCFIDLVSDIAVLAEPPVRSKPPKDRSEFPPEEFTGFGDVRPVPLAMALDFDDQPVRVLSHNGLFDVGWPQREWVNGRSWFNDQYSTRLRIIADQQIVGGTSGGPVVDRCGKLIGVLTHGSDNADSDGTCDCWATIARRALPGWILDKICKCSRKIKFMGVYW